MNGCIKNYTKWDDPDPERHILLKLNFKKKKKEVTVKNKKDRLITIGKNMNCEIWLNAIYIMRWPWAYRNKNGSHDMNMMHLDFKLKRLRFVMVNKLHELAWSRFTWASKHVWEGL